MPSPESQTLAILKVLRDVAECKGGGKICPTIEAESMDICKIIRVRGEHNGSNNIV